MGLQRKYKCTFCEKDFTRKSWYERHLCEKKKRFLDSNNITHIRAHRLFNHWQKAEGFMRKGKQKTYEEFCKSPYYGLFVRLSEFTERVYVISSYKYLDWLIENKKKEADWFDERGLQEYQNFIRHIEDPEVQAKTTCANIKTWCNSKGIDPDNFFGSISPGQALSMVRENKISPWVLFGYSPSMENLVSRMQGEVLFGLDEHINVNWWLDRVEEEKGKVNQVIKCCEESLHEQHRNT